MQTLKLAGPALGTGEQSAAARLTIRAVISGHGLTLNGQSVEIYGVQRVVDAESKRSPPFEFGALGRLHAQRQEDHARPFSRDERLYIVDHRRVGLTTGAVAVRPGTREHLAALYARHAPGAVRLGYLLTGDPDLAQDIASEAFIRISSRLTRMNRPDQFSAYLYRTVVNLSRSHRRNQQREANRLLAVAPENLREMPDLASREAIWRGLLKLPIRQRTAVFLRFYEDLSEAKAAEVLDCSKSALKSLTFRALEALREELATE